MNEVWTDRKLAALADFLANGYSYREIAEELGMSKEAVRSAVRRNRDMMLRHPMPEPQLSDHPEIQDSPTLPAPSSAHVSEPMHETVIELVETVKRGVKTFEALCDAMELSPAATREVIAHAREAGYALDIAGDHVGFRPVEAPTTPIEVPISRIGSRGKFAVISDLHFASKYHLRSQLVDFIGNAYEEGVRKILGPGDNVDGCYHHGRWELTHHGYEDQSREMFEGLPQHPGLTYDFITGNHDQTFEALGMVVHQNMHRDFRAWGRDDCTFHGARGAYLRLRAPGEERGLLVELWHPKKGPAYALSYHLQKHVEGYAPGCKPDAVFAGHWHQACYVPVRGVHALSSGTFQGGGSSYGKSLGGSPTIGGWRVEYATTEQGAVREFSPTFRQYFEVEHVRSVDLG